MLFELYFSEFIYGFLAITLAMIAAGMVSRRFGFARSIVSRRVKSFCSNHENFCSRLEGDDFYCFFHKDTFK